MEDVITITDPTYLTEPWTVRLAYKLAGLERLVLDSSPDRIDTDALTIKPLPDDFSPPPLPKGVPVTPQQLDRLAGRYAMDGAPVEFVFERRGDKLFMQPPGLPGFMPAIAQGPLDFIPALGGSLHFTADAAGNVTGFETARPDGVKATGKRKVAG
jgi:hypothetical protein